MTSVPTSRRHQQISLPPLVAIGAERLSKEQKERLRRAKGSGHIFWQSVHAGAKAAAEKFGVTMLWNGPASD
jgi:hypothetical protein